MLASANVDLNVSLICLVPQLQFVTASWLAKR